MSTFQFKPDLDSKTSFAIWDRLPVGAGGWRTCNGGTYYLDFRETIIRQYIEDIMQTMSKNVTGIFALSQEMKVLGIRKDHYMALIIYYGNHEDLVPPDWDLLLKGSGTLQQMNVEIYD